MRVNVDFDRCDGNGLCVYAAPDVFDLDDDGLLHYEPEPGDDQSPAVRDAVRSCPTAAITLGTPTSANPEVST